LYLYFVRLPHNTEQSNYSTRAGYSLSVTWPAVEKLVTPGLEEVRGVTRRGRDSTGAE